MLSEKLLQYIWRYRYYRPLDLVTLSGESLQVIQPGFLNRDGGPDFTAAKIKIGRTTWAGNIEIHLRASDWYRHAHQNDSNYGNIILHVVFENDLPENDLLHERIPCVELKNHIAKILLERYSELMEQQNPVPCSSQLKTIKSLTWRTWKDRLLITRWEQKTAVIAQWLSENTQHWEEAFYRLLARNFGMKVNADTFERLAAVTPLKLLSKYKSQPMQLEALLFGQAGLLEADFKDHYPQKLKQEYTHLRHKHHLENIPAYYWKWLRLRPANFPSVRIAQFAKLVQQSSHLFSKILEAEKVAEISSLFEITIHDYWRDHYRFDVPSSGNPVQTGKQFIHHLIINAVCPVIFWYGKNRNDIALQEKAVQWMQETAAENNAIIRRWKELNVSVENAADSQALLELYQHYCSTKNCLQCAIGNEILKAGD